VSVTVTDRQFTIVNTLEPGADTVAITVVDGAGRTADATLTIGAIPFQIDPADAHLPAGLSMRFTVFGSQPPYEIFSNRCECVNFCGGTGFSPSTGGMGCTTTVALSGGTFMVCTNRDVNCDTDATQLTAVDITGQTISTNLTLDEPTSLLLAPTAWSFATAPGFPYTATLRFFISGGLAPYTINSSLPGALAMAVPFFVGSTGTNSVYFDVTFNVPDGASMLSDVVYQLLITDVNGNLITATITYKANGTDPLAITPTSATVTYTGDANDDTLFTISGGVPPYSVTSLNTAVLASPGVLAGNQFVASPLATGNTTLTVTDSAITPATVNATLTVNP